MLPRTNVYSFRNLKKEKTWISHYIYRNAYYISQFFFLNWTIIYKSNYNIFTREGNYEILFLLYWILISFYYQRGQQFQCISKICSQVYGYVWLKLLKKDEINFTWMYLNLNVYHTTVYRWSDLFEDTAIIYLYRIHA